MLICYTRTHPSLFSAHTIHSTKHLLISFSMVPAQTVHGALTLLQTWPHTHFRHTSSVSTLALLNLRMPLTVFHISPQSWTQQSRQPVTSPQVPGLILPHTSPFLTRFPRTQPHNSLTHFYTTLLFTQLPTELGSPKFVRSSKVLDTPLHAVSHALSQFLQPLALFTSWCSVSHRPQWLTLSA